MNTGLLYTCIWYPTISCFGYISCIGMLIHFEWKRLSYPLLLMCSTIRMEALTNDLATHTSHLFSNGSTSKGHHSGPIFIITTTLNHSIYYNLISMHSFGSHNTEKKFSPCNRRPLSRAFLLIGTTPRRVYGPIQISYTLLSYRQSPNKRSAGIVGIPRPHPLTLYH